MGYGKRHRPEQIIAKLREADAMLADEASIGQVCQRLAVSEATSHRWRLSLSGPYQLARTPWYKCYSIRRVPIPGSGGRHVDLGEDDVPLKQKRSLLRRLAG